MLPDPPLSAGWPHRDFKSGDNVSRARDAAETALLTLRLDRATETISGTLADEQGDQRPFWAGSELSGALEELRGAEPRVEDPATPLEQGREK